MAIQKQVKELVEQQGAHRAKVTTASTKPRQYMAACRDCDFKGGVGSGGQAEKEALAHAQGTVKAPEAQAAAAS